MDRADELGTAKYFFPEISTPDFGSSAILISRVQHGGAWDAQVWQGSAVATCWLVTMLVNRTLLWICCAAGSQLSAASQRPRLCEELVHRAVLTMLGGVTHSDRYFF